MALVADINEYVKGKTWFWYVPAWLFGLYIFVKLLSFELGGQLPFIIAVPQAFDFILHEMAHILLAFAPALITASAGSFSEILLGSLLIWGAFKGRTYFASLFCFLWFMLACQSAGDYMSDARAQQLPLVSFGDTGGGNVIHDWNFVFGKLGILELDTFIGGTVRSIGTLGGLFGLGFAAWLIYKMAGAKDEKTLTQKETELLLTAAAKAGADTPQVKSGEKKELYPAPTKGRLSDDSHEEKHPKS